MIDYLCIFANEAAARSDATVGAFWTGSVWNTSTVFPNVKVSTSATLVNGVNPATGWWIIVSRLAAVAALDALCAMKLDRVLGETHGAFEIGTTISGSDRTGLSFSPEPHGAKYPAPLGEALPITFGAIRWDPWYGNNPAYNSFQTAATFSDVTPVDWRSRAPLHANLSTSPITWADSQATFDNEINVAANGGLDYWAYLYYGASSATNMNGGLNYHLSSSIAGHMKFSLIALSDHLGTPASHATEINDIVSKMQNAAYMTVSGRPLLYVYILSSTVSIWGSNAGFASCLSDLRSAATTAGLQNPFIVSVGEGQDAASLATFGVDAVSGYGAAVPTGNGSTYASLDATVQSAWTARLTASSIVPPCMVGWDPRPRNQAPESFATAESNWAQTPTVSEFTSHLVAARNYIINNPARCPALTALVYAWSEYDEGGVMPAPTVGDPAGTLSQAFGAAKVSLVGV